MYRSYSDQGPNENVISFIPPGFCHSIDVQFPRQYVRIVRRGARHANNAELVIATLLYPGVKLLFAFLSIIHAQEVMVNF